MAFESAADLAGFFDMDAFGTAATYSPSAGGASYSVNGIFDNEYLPSFDGDIPIENRDPTFTCSTSDIESPIIGDAIEIDGAHYEVVGVRPDGTGVLTLDLREAVS